MVNPTLTYDNEYNRRLASILNNFDDIEASRNSPTMIVGGLRPMRYINSGNTPYDGREGTANFSGAIYGGRSSGGATSGGYRSGGRSSGGRSSGGRNSGGYLSGGEVCCDMEGGVNRLKKAKKWTSYAVDTAKQGMDLAKSFGGKKVNHLKKAKKWTAYAVDTAKQGMDLAKAFGGVNRLKKAKKWTSYAVDTAKQGMDLAKAFGGRMPIAGLPKPRTAKATGYGKKTERGAIVSKVMKEHGLSLPQASKFVKEHNLYTR